jgi:TnpA family transposase
VPTRRVNSVARRPAHPLWDAIAHYGRIAKTLHILRLADEPGYRRQIKVQANLQEGRHALARKIFHGKAGQLYQRYQDGTDTALQRIRRDGLDGTRFREWSEPLDV